MEVPRNESRECETYETGAVGAPPETSDHPSAVGTPQPETAQKTTTGTPPLQPPKRKYTSSEKSRAASRKNLEKANQAPHWLKYRRTDRRMAACYHALEKAVAEMRRFDSPHYGLGFKRGTNCASLLRSLALAGETREEYEAHLERMRKAFAPLSERDRKLVLAAAQAVWRRLRVYGGQGRWELYALASILAELIAERKAEAERRAAAELAGEKVEPLDPYHDPFGSERAIMLGLHLIGLLAEDGVEKEAGRLNRRIRMLLEALGQEPPEPEEGDAAQSAAMDAETFAALNGNPLRPVAQSAATLNQERKPLKDPSQWPNAQDAGSRPEGKRKPDPHPCENVADLARRGGLMRLLRRQGVNNPLFSRLEGPDGKAVWIDLWQRAFGIDDGRLTIEDCKTRPTETSVAGSAQSASGVFPSSVDNRQSSILHMAEITWERIQMHLQHREREAAQVKEVLESCIAARQATLERIDDCKTAPTEFSPDSNPANTKPTGEPGGAFQSSIGNRQSAIPQASILLLAALGVYKCLGAVLEAGKDIKAAYYRMLVALYGDLPRFEFFKPKAPTLNDRVNDLGDFVLNLFATKNGPLQQEKDQNIKWRGRSGPQPLGGP